MGLAKTGRRLAEDGSPYLAQRLAEDGSPHRAGWKCCQCGGGSSNVANFQLGIGRGYRTEDKGFRTLDFGRLRNY